MNERYTYGYNNGFNADTLNAENIAWDVGNEYINSLSEIMNDYNKQVEKLDEIAKTIEVSQKKIEENNNKKDIEVTEEQMRAWYNEDYLLNGSLRSFEAYKKDMLDYLQKSMKMAETSGRFPPF